MLNHHGHVALFLLVLSVSASVRRAADMVSCEVSKRNISMMTKDNLFFEKITPLVIGHRGNPMLYQENTLSGFKSLLELNVDGFETDIFLTKDKKLVLYHDVNTMELTGENYQITEMTYDEIEKLNIKKKLIYGDRVYDYTKTEKIPLLEDLLMAMKDSGLLMILEMKPSDPPYNLVHSRETGIEVAKMVKKLSLEKQVVVSSFNPFQLYHARKELNELNTCFLVSKEYWDDNEFLSASRSSLTHLEDLKQCVQNISDSDYGRFILETPAVVKAIGASSLDMDYDIYNNPKYSSNTYEMFKKNYGENFSYGAWTIYKMKFNQKELDDSEKMIKDLIDKGAERLYTDDAPRLLKKLGRPVHKNSALPSFAHHIKFLYFIISVLLVSSWIQY